MNEVKPCEICGLKKSDKELFLHHYIHFCLVQVLQSDEISSDDLTDKSDRKLKQIFSNYKPKIIDFAYHKFPQIKNNI